MTNLRCESAKRMKRECFERLVLVFGRRYNGIPLLPSLSPILLLSSDVNGREYHLDKIWSPSNCRNPGSSPDFSSEAWRNGGEKEYSGPRWTSFVIRAWCGKNEIGNLTYPGIEASWHRPREPRHRISRVDSWVKGGRNETVAFLSLRR